MKLILRGFYSVVSNLYWQNQCGVGQREPLEAIWTNISAWAVHIEMVDQGYDLAYEYFRSRRNPHNLSVGPMPVLGHLPSKKKKKSFLMFRQSLLCFSLYPLLSSCWVLLERAWLCLCIFCSDVCRHWQDLCPDCPNSFSITLYERCSNPSNILVIFCCALSIMSIFLF